MSKVALVLLLSLGLVSSNFSPCEGAGDASCLDVDASFLIQKDVKNVKKREKQRALQAEADQAKAHQAHAGGLHLLEVQAQPVMDDVQAAFTAMGSTGKAISVSEGNNWPNEYDSYTPPYTNHIEGMQRFRPTLGQSTYMAFSGPGDTYSHLFIAELSGTPAAAGPIVTGGSTPQGSIIKTLDVESGWNHAGGFQISGDILAVGLEKGCEAMYRLIPGMCAKDARVDFYNVSDPSNPVKLSVYIDRSGTTAGAVGVVKQASGAWLVIAGDDDNNDLTMYVQQSDGSFKSAATWSKSEMLTAPGVSGSYKSYQSMNLITDPAGTIWMVATTRSPQLVGHDYFDLFKVQPSGGGRAQITMMDSKSVTSTGGVDFSAGAGIYVDSSTNLIGYGSGWLPSSGTVGSLAVEGTEIPVNEF